MPFDYMGVTVKYIVMAYDTKENKWYETGRYSVKRKAERAKEDLEFQWVECKIIEED